MLPLLAALAMVAACPGGAASWRQCAVAAMEVAAIDQNLAITSKLARLQPHACEPAHLLGVLFDARGDRGEARAWLDRAHSACPDDPAILFDWGRVTAAAGCEAEAIGALTRAALATPGDHNATRELETARTAAALRFVLHDRRIGELGDSVEAALASEQRPTPNLLDDWRHLVRSLDLQRMREPWDPEVVLRLAELQRIGIDLRQDRARARAIELAGRALELRPQWSAAHLLLGTLELTSEPSRPVEAERAFLSAVNYAVAGDPSSSAWLGLYMVYATTGRSAAAAEVARVHLADKALLPLDRGFAGR